MRPGANQHLNQREQRRRTVLPAKLRDGLSWSDACILNISSRGLLVYSDKPAEPGSAVELRRGAETVIARVVWRSNNRMGLASTHPLAVQVMIKGDTAAAAAPAFSAGHLHVAHQRQGERNRLRARIAQFLCVLVIGAALAGAIGALVMDSLSRPAEALQEALGRSGPA